MKRSVRNAGMKSLMIPSYHPSAHNRQGDSHAADFEVSSFDNVSAIIPGREVQRMVALWCVSQRGQLCLQKFHFATGRTFLLKTTHLHRSFRTCEPSETSLYGIYIDIPASREHAEAAVARIHWIHHFSL